SARKLRPSTHPKSCRPCRKAENQARPSGSVSALRPPIMAASRRTRSPCCARAASGQAVAPPSSVLNSRRLIQSPRPLGRGERYPQIFGWRHDPRAYLLSYTLDRTSPLPRSSQEARIPGQRPLVQSPPIPRHPEVLRRHRRASCCPHAIQVSNLIEDITLTHCAHHFLSVRVGDGVLELSSNRATSSTFERDRCYIVCDTHPSFMTFVVRYQAITNPDTSDDGGFPALVSN